MLPLLPTIRPFVFSYDATHSLGTHSFLSSFVPSLPLIAIILAPRSSYRYFDSKKMIAFSSILHSNPSFASIVCMNGIGVLCGILTSIAHSFSSSAPSLFAGPLINKTYPRY